MPVNRLRTIFITGAGSGFGEATARRFANAGWRTVICGRRAERIETLAGELRAKTPSHAIALDVRDHGQVSRAIAELPPEFTTVDVLVNNAGLALGLEKAWEAKLEDWEAMVDTNIKGLLYLTRALLPGMVARGTGHIVNIGSIAGSWPYPGANVYGATKAFVRQFSLALRADLLGTKVRVTDVEPGLAETEFSMVRFKGDKERAAQVYSGTQPLTADDIAETIEWVVGRPEHVNINTIELMPTCQAWGPLAIQRNS